MKGIFAIFWMGMIVSTADARIVLKDVPVSPFGFYRTTDSAVRQTLDRAGFDYEVIRNGDLKLYISQGGKEFRGLLLFTRFKGTRVIRRITIIAGFGTKPNRYNDMIHYVNNWNKTKVVPRLYMLDEDSLRMEIQIPASYGFSPEELTRTMRLFRAAMFYIAREIDDMRR